MAIKDYKGQIIGRLTFLEYEKRNGEIVWKTQCQCGEEQWFRGAYISTMLNRGSNFECSKCKWERKSPTLTDKIFGRLTVLKEVPGKDHHRWWLCKCECGVEKEVPSIRLMNKTHPTKSCGCLARKLQSKWVNTTQYPPAHQLRTKNTQEIPASLYMARNAFVAACYRTENARYKNHGAFGHTVCDLWRNGAKDFVKWAIKKGYKPGDGVFLKEGKSEFSPKNCYVESKKKYNKINNSKFIEFNGKIQSITDWANELGCTISCLSQRLRKFCSYPIEKVMDISWAPDKKNIYGTEHFEKEIVQLYEQGKSYEEICDHLGCSASTIKRFLKKNKISSRQRFCRSAFKFKEQMENVHALVKEGKSYGEISKQLDLEYQSMLYHYRKFLKEMKE